MELHTSIVTVTLRFKTLHKLTSPVYPTSPCFDPDAAGGPRGGDCADPPAVEPQSPR